MTKRAFFYKESAGIRITVRPAFLPDQSSPELGQFVFAYHIRIENVGTAAAQLRSRRWHIHDPVAGDSIVEGDGVVGEQPDLAPGSVHEYRSFCVLKGPSGWMEGHYRFVRADGTPFQALIPRFELDAKPRPDTVT